MALNCMFKMVMIVNFVVYVFTIKYAKQSLHLDDHIHVCPSLSNPLEGLRCENHIFSSFSFRTELNVVLLYFNHIAFILEG